MTESPGAAGSPDDAGKKHDREILRLAVPALGALLAEPIFLLIDAAIVGHLGRAPLAGLGVAGAALSTLVNLCIFLAYATTSSVARRIGAGDLRGALQQGIDGLWLAVLIGVGLGAAGAIGAPAIVRALGATPEAFPHAVIYLRISAFGVPAMLLVLAATGTLRGLHEVRTPLVVAAAGAAVNAALNYLLVYPAGLGIAGSALGTVVTQFGMAAAYLAVTLRAAHRHGAGLRPDWPGIRAAATASSALLLRTISLRIYLLAGTATAALSGTVALAAHTIAFNVWNFLALVLDAIAIAAQAIVGRSLGAGDTAGVRESTRRMVRWGVAMGVLCGVFLIAARPWTVPLFTPDPEVQGLLASVLVVVALFQPVSGVVFVLDGVLIGAGDGRYLAMAGIGTTGVFLVGAAISHVARTGLVGLWWAVGVYMLARLVALGTRARGTAWMVTGATR